MATPTGAAGGGLTGSYPDPDIGAAKVGDSNIDLARPIGRDKLVAPEAVHLIGGGGEPAFANSWSNAAGFAPAGFWLDAASGLVHLQGTITHANPGANSIFFTLPEGWRPVTDKLFGAVALTTGSTLLTVRIRVNANGAASVIEDLGANCQVYLDALSFRVP